MWPRAAVGVIVAFFFLFQSSCCFYPPMRIGRSSTSACVKVEILKAILAMMHVRGAETGGASWAVVAVEHCRIHQYRHHPRCFYRCK